jgi:hypothetical protein
MPPPPPAQLEPAAAAPSFPPAPWAIAAEAPAERRFRRFELEGATLWTACYVHPMSDACLQPEFALEQAGALEPTRALDTDLPKLEYIDLRLEPERHWKTVGHKSDRGRNPCHADQYIGPRGLTGLYGRYPDDLWMTVERSGEEPAMSSVTTLYRFQDQRWKDAGTQRKLGDTIARMFRWNGGMLALVETQRVASRFETFGTRAGVRPPRLPKDQRLDELVVHTDGTLTAYDTSQSFVRLIGWAPRDPRPITADLRVVLVSGDESATGKITMSNGRVEIVGFGEIPITGKLADETRTDPLRATLALEGGRWKVVEEKPDASKREAPVVEFPATVPELEAFEGFRLIDKRATADGTIWVTGEVDAGGKSRTVLLRNRPISAPWRASDATLGSPEPKLVPNCNPDDHPNFPAAY